mmetsp:Transcript_69408/g.144737  ORF Transcript_69408/g.144737 Transcript_69408/m.144737 type:complete len:215 (+) Transcript_69408:1095-1739(+)
MPPHPLVLKCLLPAETQGGIQDDEPLDQVLRLLADIGEVGRVEAEVGPADVPLHVVVGLSPAATEWMDPRQEDVEDDSKAPHVSLGPVPDALEDLGSHVRERACLLVQPLAPVSAARQKLGKPEVCDLDLPVRLVRVQDVLGLEVAVDDAARVHVSDALQDLPEGCRCIALRERTLCDSAEQFPAHRKLHHDVERVRSLKPIHQLDERIMVNLC